MSCGQMRPKLTCIRVIARAKYGGQKELPKIQSTSSVIHGGGGFMVWACMAAAGTSSLVYNR
uniref:Uncharacterized protein n=1 Tax=Anguilla anguilla TaxID=7936 RepID=A0A0E9PVR5_ANGAN